LQITPHSLGLLKLTLRKDLCSFESRKGLSVFKIAEFVAFGNSKGLFAPKKREKCEAQL